MKTRSTAEIHPGSDASAEAFDPITAGSPRLVVALHCHRPKALGRRVVLDQLDGLRVARDSTRGRIERTNRVATLFVDDPNVSRQHLAIRRSGAGWLVEDLGSKNGTFVDGKAVDSVMLANGNVIEAGTTIIMFLQDDESWRNVQDRDLEASVSSGSAFDTLNVHLEQRVRQLVKLAPSPVPILVRGESGTGKERIARTVHEHSGRKGVFVAVNCGALSRELIESELFGHRRGAFSGASEEREGLIRKADRGTLFLDEIAELPPDSQASLLRVLQEGEVRPVGANEIVNVDVRVVAATHQDLQQRIVNGRFRDDLYARIAGYEVLLPALRERREDLGMLIAAILPKVCSTPERVTLQTATARALFRYPWPLNIRELEHVLQVAVGLGDGDEIQLEHLPTAIREHALPHDPAIGRCDRALRARLISLLRRARGNIAAVARDMNRAPNQIRRWCRRLEIDIADFRD